MNNLQRFLVEVEFPRGFGATFMQTPSHAKCSFNLRSIGIVKARAIGNKFRHLPSCFWVFRDERVVEPELSRHLARERLSGTIDNFIRTGTGMTIHVTFAPAFEIKREVRKALFNRRNMFDVFPLTANRAANIVQDLRPDVLDELRIEITHLVERIEFMNHASRIHSHAHLQLVGVGVKNLVPQLIRRSRTHPFRPQDINKGIGELSIPIGMPHHGIATLPVEMSANDTLLRALRFKEILTWCAFGLACRGICRKLIFAKRVLRKVIIRRTIRMNCPTRCALPI